MQWILFNKLLGVLGYWLYSCLYWIILGVVSSIGMGMGIPTGPFCLFPYIVRLPGTGIRKFVSAYSVSFLWGIGTVLGELPPYAIAKLGHIQPKDLEWHPTQWWLKYLQPLISFLNWIVVDFTFLLVSKGGIWALIALASWPNLAFDICGIACGSEQMPFQTFCTGLFIGKGVVKTFFETLVMLGVGELTQGILPLWVTTAGQLCFFFFGLRFAYVGFQHLKNGETRKWPDIYRQILA